VPRLTPAPNEPSVVAGALGDHGWSQLDFPVLGTTATLAVRGGGPGLLVEARALLDEYDRRWNPDRPESLIAQIEAAEGAAVPVDDETFELVLASVEAARLTGGAIGSEGLDLNAVLTRVGAPEGSVFDIDDQARAAVADLVAAALVEAGADGAVVDVGGALRLAGTVGEDGAWVIDVFDPDGDGSTVLARLGIAEGASATVEHPTRELASVTVLADTAATAIVWAAAGDVGALESSGHPALVVPVEGDRRLLNDLDAFLR
jgi:thiamine biosynthesis lipoprotein ApbE